MLWAFCLLGVFSARWLVAFQRQIGIQPQIFADTEGDVEN